MSKRPSRIVQANVDALIMREIEGRIEHGDDMDRKDFTPMQWLEELNSELLDAANYSRKLMEMLPRLASMMEVVEYQVRPRDFPPGRGWRSVDKRHFSDYSEGCGYPNNEWERRKLYAFAPGKE